MRLRRMSEVGTLIGSVKGSVKGNWEGNLKGNLIENGCCSNISHLPLRLVSSVIFHVHVHSTP